MDQVLGITRNGGYRKSYVMNGSTLPLRSLAFQVPLSISRCRSRASSVCLRSRRCRNALSWTLKVRPMKRVHKGTATMPWHGTSEVYCTSFKSSCGIDTSSLLDISWYQFPHKWPQFCGSVRLPVNLSVASFRLTITARPTPESVDS